ncbi:hypothetical protein [Paraburkholderia youngii]|uniref:hypothetical protein n=1 Tax=Paraburkholderia youngii TaxID=2782701 RepID=UPI003D2328FD
MNQATNHALAIRVTEADLLAVLRRYSLKVANTSGKPFEVLAEELFDDLMARVAESAAARHGSDRFSQESAAQASIAQQLAALGILAISEEELKASPLPLTPAAATSLLLSYVGDVGDLYTDAPEYQASVKASENISSLASRLARRNDDSSFFMPGSLRLNGEHRAEVEVALDGRVHLRNPEMVSTDVEGGWTVQLATGRTLNVELFESEGDANWVVDGEAGFYNLILGEAA